MKTSQSVRMSRRKVGGKLELAEWVKRREKLGKNKTARRLWQQQCLCLRTSKSFILRQSLRTEPGRWRVSVLEVGCDSAVI